MHWEIIGRTLLGILTGFICGLFPLALGFVLGKKGGGIIGVFVCAVCGGIFGFLEKSIVLSIIVAVIVIIFLLVDKSRSTPVKHLDDDTLASEEAECESLSAEETAIPQSEE